MPEGIREAISALFAVCAASAIIEMLSEDQGLSDGVRMACALAVALNVLRLAGRLIKAL